MERRIIMAATRTTQARAAQRQVQKNTRRYAQEQEYIHGNTVRKLAPAQEPGRHPKREPHREPQRRQRQHVDYGTLRRNQEKALQVDLPYVVMLVIASCFTLYICVNYLHIQADINARMNNIKVLEQTIETLKSENDAAETRINASVDLEHVYRVATEELGMVYAGKDQVILYNKTESEYVRQNEDIPQY